MGKLSVYVLTMSGILLLFYLGGLIDANPLLQLLISPESMETSTFYATTLLGGLVAVTGIAIGIITKNIEIGVATTVIPAFAVLLWNIIPVFTRIKAENPVLALLLFAPLLFLFMLTVFEAWRGIDT